jgi:hypothetical protein
MELSPQFHFEQEAICPHRPSQNEYRKRAMTSANYELRITNCEFENAECGVREKSDFRHRPASCASPCEIMPRAKAFHYLRRISQGEPCGIRNARPVPRSVENSPAIHG